MSMHIGHCQKAGLGRSWLEQSGTGHVPTLHDEARVGEDVRLTKALGDHQ